jgi:hypothetical protein
LEVPESPRRGVPRGQSRPIGGTKFLVATQMILYPRGKTLRGIAGDEFTSANLIAKWRTEKRFKDLVRYLEEDFALYVLSQMGDREFLDFSTFIGTEIMHWSDRVLRIFCWNIAEAIRRCTGETDFLYLVKERWLAHDVWYLNLPLPECSEPIPRVELIVPPRESDRMEDWQDLLSGALQTVHFEPWQKPGPKPKKERKADLVREGFDKITVCLEEIGKHSEDPIVRRDAMLARISLVDLREMLKVTSGITPKNGSQDDAN